MSIQCQALYPKAIYKDPRTCIHCTFKMFENDDWLSETSSRKHIEHNLVNQIILTPTTQSLFHKTLAANKEYKPRLIMKY